MKTNLNKYLESASQITKISTYVDNMGHDQMGEMISKIAKQKKIDTKTLDEPQTKKMILDHLKALKPEDLEKEIGDEE